MINDTTLPAAAFYYEYPDDHISIGFLVTAGKNNRFEVILWLNPKKTETIKCNR